MEALAGAVEDQWHNQTLVGVNDCVVRLGVMQGEFHWHHHDEEDEFFYVVDGRFLFDLEEGGQTVDLGPKQGFTLLLLSASRTTGLPPRASATAAK